MNRTLVFTFAACLATVVLAAHSANAQQREQQIIQSSSKVVDDIMAIHLRGIPEAMLADAEGIAIIPDVIKASVGIGGRHGKGVLLLRDERRNWQLPIFVSLTGGNIGWQIGVQSTDLILVFKTPKSVQGILNGKLTLGGDLAVAAGPVGREAAAATDARLKAEIYSYSRSRGLFAGASVDGSVLRVEPDMNAAFYAWHQSAGIPASEDPAVQLVAKIAAYSSGGNPIEYTTAQGVPLSANDSRAEILPSPISPTTQIPAATRAEDVVRGRLIQATSGMYTLLDPSWKSYLALPMEVYRDGAVPSLESLQAALTRYDAVAQDPRYKALTSRPEFQTARSSLADYVRLLSDREKTLSLPAPPADNGIGVQLR